MRNLLFLCLLGLALLQQGVEAIFLGPIAVGAVIGALAVGKGFLLGSLLASKRSRKQHHYNPKPAYYKHYTKQTTYYYSSNSYSYRGKRFAPDIEIAELDRFKREVADKVLTDEWYLEMVEKDADDCTKRLVCEVAHKQASGDSLSSIEEGVMDIFGKGVDSVDTSKTTAIFDFAAQAGKYWKVGGVGCDFFRRCDTPVNDILAMIETELEDFEKLEESMKGSEEKVKKKMDEEKIEVEEMLQSLDSDIRLEQE